MLRSFMFSMVALACATTVQAGALGSLLKFDGSRERLSDDSATKVFDVGTAGGQLAGNGLLDVGDVVQGIFEIRSVSGTQTGSVSSTIMGLTALEVTAISSNPNPAVLGVFDTVISLGAVGSAQLANLGFYDLNTFLADAVNPFDLSGLNISDPTSPSFAVISRTDGNYTIDPSASNTLSLDGDADAFGLDGDDWAVELLGGLVGDDFYQINVSFGSGNAPPLTPVFPTAYATAFTVIGHSFGPGVSILETEVDDFFGNTVYGNVVTAGNNGLFAPNDATPINFTASDDGDFIIAAVPEPSSLSIIGLLSLAGFVSSRKRIRRR